MRILGGLVFADGAFVETDVVIEQGRIASLGTSGEAGGEGLDARGCYVVPGFIDLHFHGCAGHDFTEGSPEALSAIALYEASRGVTAICPATMTYPESILTPVMEAAAAFIPADDESAIVGINMEGPFISRQKLGAQNPSFVQPCDIEMFRRLQDAAGGLIKLVDIAPEEPGALDFIRGVASEVCVSIAHTCADYDTAVSAFDAGACHLTHTCNAMPPLLHRDPGPIGAAIDSPQVHAELIADGVHVHPSMIRVLFSLFGDERMVLVSDSMEATGLSDGRFALGGQVVIVKGKEARVGSGSLAGSVCDLAACVQTAVRDAGIPLVSVLRAATENPARVLGIDSERGSISPGKIADCVVLDDDLNIAHVVLRGQLLY